MRQERIARSDEADRRGRAPGRGPRRLGAAGLLLSLATLACAPATQRVALEVGPAPVQIFVDGEPVPGAPPEIELRADRPHVLFFRRDGYQAEQVVLRSVRDEAGPRLDPAEVRVLLRPLSRTGGEVEVELE